MPPSILNSYIAIPCMQWRGRGSHCVHGHHDSQLPVLLW